MKIEKIINYIFLVLCCLTIVWSLKFIISKNKWSPIDEYAHMDYMDKLENGHLPKLSDQISEELFQHIKNNPDKVVGDTIKTREQLGFGNYSYQAKHPPLYYETLILPDIVMKKLNFDIFQRLKVLRLISYLIFVIGMFLCISIVKQLNQLNFNVPLYFGTACFLFGLLICTHERYGLGNNLMSPLLINTSVLFILKYYKHPTNKLLYLSVGISCLSIFSALTNIFLLPVLFLLIFIKFISQFSWKNFFISSVIILCFTALYFIWKNLSIPNKEFEEYMQHILSIYIPANAIDYKTFIGFLSNDTFQLSFLSPKLDVSSIVFVLMSLNLVVSVIFFKTLLRQKWLLITLIAFLYYLVLLYFLNKYVATVTWVGFRHYLGFIPIIFLSCFGFIILIYSKYFNRNSH